ncbi:TetR/AcrR family transcriptional regulator [Saccharothrix obliqua]|uniref:TetR/AcrR family transcriptional regulator n=1 Tax=Saccharothrix obliqua TaxID=2861747 RepID=UPI001C5EF591|nr:TetR/AcrR family transcriptional regulator [Saccharothrix obliqua]MBW4718717.1 TetR/AcrR family transcriptional regulator [Saccharothrix obliqua]
MPRKPRQDAEDNRRRILEAAIEVMLREGRNAPLATIAAEAGVGVGTLYRSYPDRSALLQALEYRAYGLLGEILDGIRAGGVSGLPAIGRFLAEAVAIGDQLVLPLHGSPALVTPPAVEARLSIHRGIDDFIAAGRADGSIRCAVNATDVIVFSAVITQPLARGRNWDHMARRQIAIFLNGLAAGGPTEVPGPVVEHAEVERAFLQRTFL